MVAHVLGLLLGHGQPDQPDLAERVARAQLLGQGDHLPLRLERGRVHRPRPLDAEPLARVVVEERDARDQEAAVAPARAARHGAGLEQDRVDAVLREPARARQPAHATADHARLHLEVAVERRPRLVGRVEPEGRGAGAHAAAPSAPSTGDRRRRGAQLADQLRRRVASRSRCGQRHVHRHRAVARPPIERDGHRAEADLVLLARVRDALATNSLQVRAQLAPAGDRAVGQRLVWLVAGRRAGRVVVQLRQQALPERGRVHRQPQAHV